MQGAAHFSLALCKYKMVYDINQIKVRKNEPIRYKFIFPFCLIRFICYTKWIYIGGKSVVDNCRPIGSWLSTVWPININRTADNYQPQNRCWIEIFKALINRRYAKCLLENKYSIAFSKFNCFLSIYKKKN